MIDVKRIQQIPLFQKLSAQDQKALAEIAELRTVHKGDMLFSPGDSRKEFFGVLTGNMHVYRTFNDEVQTLAYLDAGDFAVESALVESDKHEHSGEMLSDGELLVLDGKKFTNLAKEHPGLVNAVYGRVIANLTERLHHVNNKLVTIYSTGKIVSTYDNLDNLTDLILTTILEIIRAKRALFVLFKPLEDKILVQDAKGYRGTQRIKNLEVSLGSDPILGTIYKYGREVNISASKYERQTLLHTPYASRNMLGVPLQLRDRVFGAILLGDKEGAEEFSHNNLILLNIIARQIVLPIAIAELQAERRE